MRCDDVSLLLSESAEASAQLPRSIARHAEHCLRCQAEAAQYRRIRRTMLSMRDAWIDPGVGMVAEVMSVVSEDPRLDPDPPDRRRAAYVAAAAAAGAAGAAAGALVLAARSKRPAS